LNVQSAEVNRVVAAALGGEVVGTLLEGNRQREIVVRLGKEKRDRIDHLRGLQVRTGDGGVVPIERVVRFELVPQVDAINRELGRRRAAVMVNIEGRDVESFVAEARAQIHSEVDLPEGYHIDIGGQFENLQAARQRLMFVVPTALAFIFLLVFAALGSLRQSALVYTGIPLAMTGGIFALAVRGLPFSISAAVGFIALSGVAVLNGLVLINCFNELREEGMEVGEAVITGALTRLRPVLMTALVASLGFVPMAIATGAGAEVQRPLATVVIGGILTSTFLTLLLLPSLYYWVEKGSGSGPEALVG
jgi:cobalt-zinc-cadmium resistance protein CzcA